MCNCCDSEKFIVDNGVKLAYSIDDKIYIGREFNALPCLQKKFIIEHEKSHIKMEGNNESETDADLMALKELHEQGLAKKHLIRAVSILDKPHSLERLNKCLEFIDKKFS